MKQEGSTLAFSAFHFRIKKSVNTYHIINYQIMGSEKFKVLMYTLESTFVEMVERVFAL